MRYPGGSPPGNVVGYLLAVGPLYALSDCQDRRGEFLRAFAFIVLAVPVIANVASSLTWWIVVDALIGHGRQTLRRCRGLRRPSGTDLCRRGVLDAHGVDRAATGVGGIDHPRRQRSSPTTPGREDPRATTNTGDDGRTRRQKPWRLPPLGPGERLAHWRHRHRKTSRRRLAR